MFVGFIFYMGQPNRGIVDQARPNRKKNCKCFYLSPSRSADSCRLLALLPPPSIAAPPAALPAPGLQPRQKAAAAHRFQIPITVQEHTEPREQGVADPPKPHPPWSVLRLNPFSLAWEAAVLLEGATPSSKPKVIRMCSGGCTVVNCRSM
jgi:hypothetical protein